MFDYCLLLVPKSLELRQFISWSGVDFEAHRYTHSRLCLLFSTMRFLDIRLEFRVMILLSILWIKLRRERESIFLYKSLFLIIFSTFFVRLLEFRYDQRIRGSDTILSQLSKYVCINRYKRYSLHREKSTT